MDLAGIEALGAKQQVDGQKLQGGTNHIMMDQICSGVEGVRDSNFACTH